MNHEAINKAEFLLSDLEDKAFNNVEKRYNEFLVEDYLDAKLMGHQTNVVIDDYDWYLYWLSIRESSMNLLNLISNLLEANKEKWNLLERAMKTKALSEKRLIESNHYDPADLLPEESNKSAEESEPIPLASNHSENLIKTLHSFLKGHRFITTDFQTFKLIFKQTEKNVERIQWLGTETEILLLFNKLFEGKYIENKYRSKRDIMIVSNFKNKQGNSFRTKQLSVLSDRVNALENKGHPINQLNDLLQP